MKVKDEIIEEIWNIKDSLVNESGGNLHKLAEIIRNEAAKIDNQDNINKKRTA
ncbi:MAG: hypothetical protein PF692_02415 [Kiritimatiellae bacterium]|jgi:hypothetical protein|nr:hypothetical protein [Kiritimatiellia bacterium]